MTPAAVAAFVQLAFSAPAFHLVQIEKLLPTKAANQRSRVGKGWVNRDAAAADPSAPSSFSFACCRVRVTGNTSRDFRHACSQHLTTTRFSQYSPVSAQFSGLSEAKKHIVMPGENGCKLRNQEAAEISLTSIA